MRKRAYDRLNALERVLVWLVGSGALRARYRSVCSLVEGFMALSERHLRLLAARCIGQRNDYALQRQDGGYVRVGAVVSLDALARHVAGLETMATYVIDEQGTCQFAVFDA